MASQVSGSRPSIQISAQSAAPSRQFDSIQCCVCLHMFAATNDPTRRCVLQHISRSTFRSGGPAAKAKRASFASSSFAALAAYTRTELCSHNVGNPAAKKAICFQQKCFVCLFQILPHLAPVMMGLVLP